jgi:hypothetical protein
MANRAVLVHSLAAARVTLDAARAAHVPVTLVSAPAAAGYAGAGWFAALVEQARAEFSDVAVDAILDCGSGAGFAMGALRAGIRVLRFDGPPEIADKIEDMARVAGARLIREPIPSLDLRGLRDPQAAALAWLSTEVAETK